MHMKISSAKWRPFCPGGDELIILTRMYQSVSISHGYMIFCGGCYIGFQVAQFVGAHDDVIKWKHFPRYWPFVWGIHRSPVNSPHKGQWRGALMFSLICARIIGWVKNGEAGDSRHQHAHYDVIVMRCINIVFHLKRPILCRTIVHTVLAIIVFSWPL